MGVFTWPARSVLYLIFALTVALGPSTGICKDPEPEKERFSKLNEPVIPRPVIPALLLGITADVAATLWAFNSPEFSPYLVTGHEAIILGGLVMAVVTSGVLYLTDIWPLHRKRSKLRNHFGKLPVSVHKAILERYEQAPSVDKPWGHKSTRRKWVEHFLEWSTTTQAGIAFWKKHLSTKQGVDWDRRFETLMARIWFHKRYYTPQVASEPLMQRLIRVNELELDNDVFDEPETIERVLTFAYDPSPLVQGYLMKYLRSHDSEAVFAVISSLLTHPDPSMRVLAVASLFDRTQYEEVAIEFLSWALSDSSWKVRQIAVACLSFLEIEESTPLQLFTALSDRSEAVRQIAQYVLEGFKDERYEDIIERLHDPDLKQRHEFLSGKKTTYSLPVGSCVWALNRLI